MAVVAFSIHRAMAMSRLVGRAPTGLFFFLLPRRPSSTQLLSPYLRLPLPSSKLGFWFCAANVSEVYHCAHIQ